ncbi:MAG TPA: peptidylprolyl isomerase [Terriglobales bacterium]|jgi:peptidyl-prolyl cis-trans isomerase D|nr:peptidylprolyl isomerase [Terriglobales bacterium]
MIRFLQTPSKAKKVLLGAMLLFICIGLLVYLIPGGSAFGFGTSEPGVLATIGDQQLRVAEVQFRARQVARQRGYPQQFIPFLTQQTAEQMILQKALLSEGARLGLRVSNEELIDELHSGAFGRQLFPDGNPISEAAYEAFVQQSFNMSVAQFEQELKDALLIRKLAELVQDGVMVSEEEIKQEYVRGNTKVKLEYAVLSLEGLMQQIKPGEAELKAYFDKNEGRYANAIPEKRKVKYVVIDRGKLADQAPADRQDLQRYYDLRRDQFRVPEEVNVRHILIKTPPPGPDGKVDPKAVETARNRAHDVLKQLKASADFAKLAAALSDDPGSKDNGGSLGWIGRGRTAAEFEKTAFSLSKGQLSDLVQTTFGFHIIRVDEKRSARLQTLDEVTATIEPLVRQEKAARMADSLADTLRTQARTSSLEQAAARNGLQVVETDFIARNDALPGLGVNPGFMEEVFAAREKSPAQLTTIQQGYALFEVTAVKPPTKPTFEQMRDRVAGEFKQERAAAMLQQRTQELSDRARAQHDLKKAAQEMGAKVKTSEFVSHDGQVPDLGAMNGPAAVAFSMKPGEISGPISLGNSGAVLSVFDRQEPSLEALSGSREQVRETMLQRKRTEVMELFASNLRKRMEEEGKIRYNKEERERIFNPRAGAAGF